MSAWLRCAGVGAWVELTRLRRSWLITVLAVVEGVIFLVLISLFGLTGSSAPTALVQQDDGPLARLFVADLANAHHSFSLQPMSAQEASARLQSGRLVASITIPPNFDAVVTAGATAAVQLDVDNLNVDLTDDVQRAVPSAIVAFGHQLHLPGIRIAADERDLIAHDTGYIPYLTVSALALVSLVVAATLAAVTVTLDFEGKTLRISRASPASQSALLAGRLAATALVSAIAMTATTLVVVFAYGVVPLAPLELVAVLLVCVIVFTLLGAWLGALLRRTFAVVPLVFGIALPLYIDSGALEPERFDGNVIWAIAHISPVYYAVGGLEHAFHGLGVTPEPVWLDVLILAAIGVALMALARHFFLRMRTA